LFNRPIQALFPDQPWWFRHHVHDGARAAGTLPPRSKRAAMAAALFFGTGPSSAAVDRAAGDCFPAPADRLRLSHICPVSTLVNGSACDGHGDRFGGGAFLAT
jgi:hypothetical protein